MQQKMMMNDVECQTQKSHWQKTNSTQTKVIVKYDEVVQVDLINEEELRQDAVRQSKLVEAKQNHNNMQEINQ